MVKKKTVDIEDWKTNDKELGYEGYNGETLQYPLTSYGTGPLSKYTIQLSLYMYMACKIYNKKPGRMIIHHLRKGKGVKIPLELGFIERRKFRLDTLGEKKKIQTIRKAKEFLGLTKRKKRRKKR